MDLFLTEKPSVLIVDTAASSVSWVTSLLKKICNIKLANDGVELLKIANQALVPDLILLDVKLPGGDGYQLCRHLNSDPGTWNIPIILFGDTKTDEEELKGFECGAIDYLSLAINPDIFRARVKTQLKHHSNVDLVRMINDRLEEVVAKRTEEVMAVQDATIHAMTSLAQTRDSETGNHIRRTQHYVRALSRQLQSHPRFDRFLTDRNIDLLFKSSPLHDIGKVGIPDRILLKPGRFESAEMEIMKTHTTLGRDAIEYAESLLGYKLDFLTTAKEIAYSHQEKWDGSGYPQGLAGDAIPISARLMALADVYDAIISRRVYKDGMPHAKAVEIIVQGRGTHFDPDIVDAFIAVIEEFKAIAARFADSDDDMLKKADYLALANEESHE